MTSNPRSIPKVKTLTDLPSNSDAFGPHKKVATTLLTVIREEEGAKAVALSGSWGSGKSTVIRLLELKSNPLIESIFVFDAWSHEGDPLRRSFLEGIISHLISSKWIDKEKWDEKKLVISRRKEEVTITRNSEFTATAKIVAASVFFVPLGIALVNKHGPGCELFRGVPLALAPLVATLAIWLRHRPTRNIFSRKFWRENRDQKSDHSIWAILRNKDTEITKSTTSKNPDPTSIEFCSIFHEILEDSLGEKDKRLVVVMDNLDRIATKTAMDLWSTMRVFFDQTRGHRLDPSKRLWLIVPLDPTALATLWGKDDNDQGIKISKSFIDKSFQLTFHVPPPVLSDWKSFMFSQLKEAFSDHDAEDFHDIYRLYMLANRDRTPRSIKIFINEIGEIYRQWGVDIPLRIQATYVLNRNRGQIEELISNKTFLAEGQQNIINDPDWQTKMAAIHFNVEIDKAIQVLVRPQIDKALTLADSVALDSIRSVPAFEENCEDLIEKSLSNWVQHEPVTIAYAAGVLKTLKLTDSLANRKSWSHLRRGIGQVTDWKGLNQKAAEGICELLRSASVDEVERLAIRTVVGIRNLKPSASNDTKPTEEWEKHSKDSIAVILETLVELKQTHTIQKHFRVPGNADAYVETLHKIGRDRPKEEILSFFISESTPEKISKTIADLCNTGNFVETHSHMIENLAIIGRRDWKELTQAFDNRLNPQVVTLNSGQALGLIESLLYLSFIQKDKHAVNSLRSSVNHGRIANYLQRALTEKHPQLQIAAIFSIMFENPTGQNANNVGESSSGYSYYNQIRISPTGHSAVIEGLASLVLKYNLVEWTVDQLGNSNLTAIIQAIVQELLVKSKSSNLISSEFFISRLKLFEAHLSRDDIESITGNLAVNQDLCAYMRSISFDISFQKIYYFLSKEAYSSQNAEMNEFLSDNLKSIQKSDWKQQLSGSLGLLDTSLNLLHSKIPIQLGFNFSDAVLEILKDLRKKQVYPEYHSNSWKDFANLMDHSNRETFFRNIVSDFLTIPSRSVSIPIKLLSDDFINSKAISERSDEFFRTVAKEIVSRSTSDSSEIECLLAILEGSSSAKDNIKKETKRALASQIQELLSKPSERSNAVVEALKSLASKIGDS